MKIHLLYIQLHMVTLKRLFTQFHINLITHTQNRLLINITIYFNYLMTNTKYIFIRTYKKIIFFLILNEMKTTSQRGNNYID